MRDDARRRFVYGITINDTLLRFWYNDRSAVIASQLFDFIEVILVDFWTSSTPLLS